MLFYCDRHFRQFADQMRKSWQSREPAANYVKVQSFRKSYYNSPKFSFKIETCILTKLQLGQIFDCFNSVFFSLLINYSLLSFIFDRNLKPQIDIISLLIKKKLGVHSGISLNGNWMKIKSLFNKIAKWNCFLLFIFVCLNKVSLWKSRELFFYYFMNIKIWKHCLNNDWDCWCRNQMKRFNSIVTGNEK